MFDGDMEEAGSGLTNLVGQFTGRLLEPRRCLSKGCCYRRLDVMTPSVKCIPHRAGDEPVSGRGELPPGE